MKKILFTSTPYLQNKNLAKELFDFKNEIESEKIVTKRPNEYDDEERITEKMNNICKKYSDKNDIKLQETTTFYINGSEQDIEYIESNLMDIFNFIITNKLRPTFKNIHEEKAVQFMQDKKKR